ncbi:MAG: hypothetical protein IJ131_10800 [Eggerthellaceae bacterium]|nr:hypothetical protein [Eggerthellaceae bacterium]
MAAWVAPAVCAFLLAGLMAAFLYLVGFREVSWLAKAGPAQQAAAWIATGAVFFVALVAGRAVVVHTPDLIARLAPFDPWRWMPLAYGRASIGKAALFVFVLWIPWIALQYPAGVNGDTFNQLYQFQTSSPTYYSTMQVVLDASFIDHHPLFDTLLFGAFWALGDALGNQNIGLFAYSICQSVACAAVLAACVCYLDRLGVPKVFRLVSLLFVALFPAIPLWCATMVKDSLFSICFAWFFLLYIEVFRTRGSALVRGRFLAAFVAASTLCVLTKKPGIYIVAVSLLVLLVYCRRSQGRARLAATLVAVPLCCSLVVPAVLYPVVGGVAPGGTQESFGFALQQVVTVVREADDLTSSERAAVEGVLDLSRALERYDVASVDPVKNSARLEATGADYLRFAGAWATIGARHPLVFARSLLSISSGLLSPGVGILYNHTSDQDPSWVETFKRNDPTGELSLTFDKPDALDGVSDQVFSLYQGVVNAPLLNIPFGRGFYGGWVPLICITLACAASRRALVAYAPVVMSVLFVLVSPVASTRYVVPLLFVTVLELGLLCYFLASSKGKSE